ncbi:MAG: PAS domain S-box protein, partial [Proteobacteria bacterium]|nr:PAS domain S-box protein [Pseudomonadota bacterium]
MFSRTAGNGPEKYSPEISDRVNPIDHAPRGLSDDDDTPTTHCRQKDLDRTLARSNKIFEQIFDSASIGMTVTDLEGRFLRVNKSFSNFIGYPIPALLELRINDVTHPDEIQATGDVRRKIIENGLLPQAREKRYVRKDGEVVWGSITRTLIEDPENDVRYVVGQIQDITQRKHAETTRDQLETRLRDFADSAADRFWETDSQHRFSYVSEMASVANYDGEGPLLGSYVWELPGVDPTAAEIEALRGAVSSQQAFRNLVFSRELPDGTQVWSRASGKPIFDSRGEFLGYRGTCTDITQEMESKEDIAALHARFIDAIENAPLGIVYWDSDDRFAMANSEFKKSNDSILDLLKPGEKFSDFIPKIVDRIGDITSELEKAEWIEAALERHRNPPPAVEVVVDGRAMLINQHRLKDGGLIAFHSDITDLKQQEKELRHAQKMEAIGQLTGGVAHDFNNLLAAILGNLEIIKGRTIDDDGLSSRIDRAIEAAKRGATLTSRLLCFSRQQSLDPQPTNLNHLIAETADLLHCSLGDSITLKLSIEPKLRNVLVDRSELENAIINLAVNARDATAGCGSVTIGFENVTLGHDEAQAMEGTPGEYVRITVEDSGEGIPEDILKNVFDPFFTTKEVGAGSGLGLSMVLGFVKQSKGCVDIKSQVGVGTKVYLYLPVVEISPGMADSPENCAAAEQPPVIEGTRVLVVEDDPDVRDITTEMLKTLGYIVEDGG